MGAIDETLRHDLRQPEFSEGYAESFQDALVATQIRVLREENHWTQADLAARIGTTQTAVSRIENVNYSAWNISTLKKLARAYRVRLKVSFETYGSLIRDVENFSRESLRRTPREIDPELMEPMPNQCDEPALTFASGKGNLRIFPGGSETGIGTQLETAPVAPAQGCLANGNNSTQTMPMGSVWDEARVLRRA